ncbi:MULTISPECIES: phosphate ABC transporter permease PstA [unclassified Moritella]|uniref:phosphate ABC transporter permease PstA n=1 Tax=unclassified Moritella TaxID=2637987 RepID=UPI001BA6664C|nr:MULTISPECIES: phosphate ABC transporter permease PstA [unclassified Moritella]QUM83713.1 phosphate ABC transporter permease PstA [Moritella sp. 28]QUM88005.1 phosphate ABC transporter permease PstA [Moritella sp. 36]
MKNWFRSGSPWIWMTGGAVSISLIAVLGLLMLIAWRGLTYFWPSAIHEFNVQLEDGSNRVVIGEIYDREFVPIQRLLEAGVKIDPTLETVERILVKTGNREYVDLDFSWLLGPAITEQSTPAALAVIERFTNGNFYGYPVAIEENGVKKSLTSAAQLEVLIKRAVELNDKAQSLQKGEISSVNYELERIRLKLRSYELKDELTSEIETKYSKISEGLRAEYQIYEAQLFSYRDQANRDAVIVKDMRGEEVRIPLSNVLEVTYPNDMGIVSKIMHWFGNMGSFVTSDPREANTEGGVFPAIFGTIFMVMLMAVIVTPLGVVAAIYLHEYAPKNGLTKMIRIAVINLAGVPSIVYGVFGLGFFVYMLGGSIDELFYPESSPSPVFGSPGVLWSALTLAILTLPVVIVSTEEGLSRIPTSLRQGSLALGATKFETLWRIIVPMASPAIMTGLILAVARAAGEVAPLMLVGVVKLAPTLPVDMNFPYIHVERKFMHLGFHIYDVGFQSPNVEAARPLVYATSFLLVTVIIGLNLTAIGVRNHLREKFKNLEL